MFNYDPRFTGGMNPQFGWGSEYPQTAFGAGYQPGFVGAGVYPAATQTRFGASPWNHQVSASIPSQEIFQLQSQLHEIKCQLAVVSELLRVELVNRAATAPAVHGNNFANTAFGTFNGATATAANYPFGMRPNGAAQNEVVRIRESDANLYCDIFLPHLTMGDVEVETNGNRIICRTRIPVSMNYRWTIAAGQLPRNFEIFEIPDGRVEYSWTCPVLFQGKDVEATFREGFLCICIPKAETSALKHTVKVVKEPTIRRAANDMNS